MRRLRRGAAILAAWAALATSPAGAEPLVLAAASTARAMDAVIEASGIDAVLSYGPSGTLARQIAAGAPADLYLSANPEWMAFLVEDGLIAPSAVEVLLSNALVLIVPAGAPPLRLEAQALSAALGGERWAMAAPATAPVGAYGQAALEALGLWATLAPYHVPTRNTLVTVATVERGEAAFGLVYRSDALDVPGVTVGAAIPADVHPPIAYPAAPLASGNDPEGGARLMRFLLSDEARVLFERHGFRVVGTGP